MYTKAELEKELTRLDQRLAALEAKERVTGRLTYSERVRIVETVDRLSSVKRALTRAEIEERSRA